MQARARRCSTVCGLVIRRPKKCGAFLVNGVFCLFVFEAVRRPYVVTVGIPLRRVTILGLLLSVPTLFLHQQIEHLREGIRESFGQPEWIWIAIAAALLFLISQ